MCVLLVFSAIFADRLQQTLVRVGAYHSLDLDISSALSQRSPDFPGVIVCSGDDSLSSLLALIAKRRVHRLVVVEGEVRVKSYINLIRLTTTHLFREKLKVVEEDGY